MDRSVSQSQNISWAEVTKPRTFMLTLNPGELFAFHEDVLDQYKGKPIKTMNSHFNYGDGFQSSGLLYGDGVCHLASLLYWAARDAGLDTYAPTNHNFANIPEVPREFGVSIYFMPGQTGTNDGTDLSVSIVEQ